MSQRTPAMPTSPNTAAVIPVLTTAQMARIATHGRMRPVNRGEVLLAAGEHSAHFFAVISGEIEVVRQSGTGEELVAVFQPGMFTGEVNMLSGRRSFVQLRASEPSAVVDVDRERLVELIQADSELSEILMRAFILRRVEIIAHGFGDVVLIGSNHCAGTLRIKEFLTRNGYLDGCLALDAKGFIKTGPDLST